MGEILNDFSLKFNGSVKLEAKAERLTSEAGAVLLRDDADALRKDAALRLAVSDSKSTGPLKQEEGRPEGLASQPTLSRLTAMLAQEGNREVLRQAVMWLTGRRLRASRPGGERLRQVTVVESFAAPFPTTPVCYPRPPEGRRLCCARSRTQEPLAPALHALGQLS